MKIKSIGVFCGASPGKDPDYTAATKMLAQTIGKAGLTLVYGGGKMGLMGLLANEALAAGAKVIGVIPVWLKDKEVAHDGLHELHLVDSFHERKAKMSELSDAFIALPGGIGTLEELFEVWSWSKMGTFEKPCGFLNVNGYYDHLMAFIDHMVAQDFLKEEHKNILSMADSTEQLLKAFENYQHPTPMWHDPSDYEKAKTVE